MEHGCDEALYNPLKKLDPSRARILSTSLFPSPPITWGLLLALPLIVTVAFAAPGEEGAKPTVTEQVPFGLTCPLQVVEIENSRDPEMLPPLKVTFDRPFFGAVLVKRTTLILPRPTLTEPKFNELVETLTTADTRGVGVAVGVGVGVGVGVLVVVGVGVVVGVEVGVAVAVGVGVALELDSATYGKSQYRPCPSLYFGHSRLRRKTPVLR